jgi:hypothetical protein
VAFNTPILHQMDTRRRMGYERGTRGDLGECLAKAAGKARGMDFKRGVLHTPW